MVVRRCSAHWLAKDRGLDRWSRLQHCGVTIVFAVVIGCAGDGRDDGAVAVADFDSLRTTVAALTFGCHCTDAVTTVAMVPVSTVGDRCAVVTVLLQTPSLVRLTIAAGCGLVAGVGRRHW
jgi:hypothetical protein